MKLSLPPHETIRVELFKENARYHEEYHVNARYTKRNVKKNTHWAAQLQLTILELNSPIKMPRSPVMVTKQGLPLMFNSTSGSNVPDKFKIDPITTPGLVVKDQIIKIEEKNVKEKILGERLIERTWTEVITRMVTIQNDSGQSLPHIIFMLEDKPTDHILLQETDPKPHDVVLPMRKWMVSLEPDQSINITVMLHHERKEKIELPQKGSQVPSVGQVQVPSVGQVESAVQQQANILNMSQQSDFD